ncbi:hypothetical protein [Cupriavidus basilensis]|uniref:Uncharacterized protein n=1 Tax=Cupriavidus basilensis TaxID=68895 RepID=A0A0C4Y7V0_9BURK|nr:hypothetical protein [Cupriavidus basilensis]AJG19080.1 hypothetical protein RR42_m1683 [Cupriavidus basilensis]
MHLCASTPIPDFNSLYNGALSAMTFPPGSISIPALPTLPNPIYPDISNINGEIVQLVQELQSYQMLTTFTAFLTPLTSFLGLSLSSILPPIPGTALTLIDLLAMNPAPIYSGISAALAAHGPSIFPYLKTPIFGSLSVPSIELVTTVKMVVKGYMNNLLDTVFGLINQVTGNLHLPAMPALPTLPTLARIEAMVIAAFPGFGSLTALINSGNASLNALLGAVVVPGFPALPALPVPLIPNYSSYEHEFNEGLNVLYSSLVAYPMTLIMSFVTGTLSMLGFSFPTVCITF